MAEIKSIPPGSIPAAVSNEIHEKIQIPTGAPESWTIIVGGDYPITVTGKRRADGMLDVMILNEKSRLETLYDPLGLTPSGIAGLATLSLTSGLSISSPISGELKAHYPVIWLPDNKGGAHGVVTNFDCKLSGSAETVVNEDCAVEKHEWNYNFDISSVGLSSSDEKPQNSEQHVAYKYDPLVGLFVDPERGQLGRISTDKVDWKIGDGPWNSQTVSSKLSPAQKEQARAAFVRGFDLYKSGDLTGARALVESGVKTDPGNYLGWFTLGEIARSADANHQDSLSIWAKNAEATYYQHTIDLAPDSPEAALAKGYLAALH